MGAWKGTEPSPSLRASSVSGKPFEKYISINGNSKFTISAQKLVPKLGFRVAAMAWARKLCFGVARIGMLVAMLTAPAAAAAPAGQPMWVERAVPDQTAKGPRHAKGAVIWVHGLALHKEDSTAPTPPYVKALEQQGWDTFRLNRMRAADSLDGTSARLAQAARDLRDQGYGRIVLAGQSFGAFAALAAVSRDGVADAVVATAPAAYGSFTDSYARWRANASELYELLRRVGKTGVMLVYFLGDDYDPGGRGDASQAILARRLEPSLVPSPIPDLIVDQPADLTGHAAAATGLFARRYAACIDRFAAGELRTQAEAATCETPWGRRP